MVIDDVVARASRYDVGASVTIDGVVSRAADDRVGAGRTRDRYRRRDRRRVDVLKVGDGRRIADRLIGGDREIDGDADIQDQRVDAAAAADRGLRPVIIDRVVAGTGGDDIRAAVAVDGAGAGARRDRVGAGRAGDGQRRRQRARVDIFKVGDGDAVARRLIDARRDGEVDRRRPARGVHDQRVDAAASVDGAFRAMIVNGVVAYPRRDDVGATVAIDGVGALRPRDHVGARGARDRERVGDRGGVDVLEIVDLDAVAGRLIDARGDRKIDRARAAGIFEDERVVARAAVDRDFRASIIDGVVARAGVDDISAAIAVDRVVAGAARERVGACVSRQRDPGGEGGRVHIGEIDDGGRPADDGAGAGEIDVGGDIEDQRVDASAAVDRRFRAMIVNRVVSAGAIDHVAAAAAVDRVGAAGAIDIVDAGGAGDRDPHAFVVTVEVLEILDDGRAADVLVGRQGEIDVETRAVAVLVERVGSRPAVDGDLGAIDQHAVVAGARLNDIGSAIGPNRVAARTANDRARGSGGPAVNGHARGHGRGVDVLKIADDGEIALRDIALPQIHRRGRFHDERVHARPAIDRRFRAMVDHGVVARARVDDVGASVAVDGVGARTRRDDVRAA